MAIQFTFLPCSFGLAYNPWHFSGFFPTGSSPDLRSFASAVWRVNVYMKIFIERRRFLSSNCTFFDSLIFDVFVAIYYPPPLSFCHISMLTFYFLRLAGNCGCRVPLVKGKSEWGMNAPLQKVVRLRKIRFKCLDACTVEKDVCTSIYTPSPWGPPATSQQTSFKSEFLC